TSSMPASCPGGSRPRRRCRPALPSSATTASTCSREGIHRRHHTPRSDDMNDRKLVLRTADQSRRADIDFDQGSTGSEIIQAAVDNWALPADVDYTLVNTTSGQVLNPSQSLEKQVKSGDVLEVQ